MEIFNCPNCGAPINKHTFKCEYCGTEFEAKYIGGSVHYIQTCPAQVVPIGCELSISEEAIKRCSDPNVLMEHCIRDLSRCIAERLVEYIKIDMEHDPYHRCQIIRGTVRVVEPDFRF